MFGVSAFAQSPFASLANKTFQDSITENIDVAATPAQIVAYTTAITEPFNIFSDDSQTLALFQDSIHTSVVQTSSAGDNQSKDTNSDGKIKEVGDNFKNDINLKSFLSTMNFIDSLCNICKDSISIPIEEQIIFIKREISDLNKELPANVYIPFLNNSIRNHFVVHMPISELRIFRTKTRVLYMTTIEIVRIDEIIK